nr:reverse transcriptase [Tanacetum cinerariifolium]
MISGWFVAKDEGLKGGIAGSLTKLALPCFFAEIANSALVVFLHCKDALLVLNWEKYHFMVKEGIMLGHKEFDIEIKDKKGAENVDADHLSLIDNNETSDDSEVDDNFLRETLMEINTRDEP